MSHSSNFMKLGATLGLIPTDRSLLRNLMWFRLFLTFAIVFAALCCQLWFQIEVPLPIFGLSIALLIVGNSLLLARLKRPRPVTQLELFLNLLFDSLVLCLFISSTGGATNPFVSLYLVLIAVSASILSTWLTLAITLFCAAIYTYFFIALPPSHAMHDNASSSFQLHLVGMWINFLLSGACLLVFIHLLRRAIAQREDQISQEKEQAIHNQHILAIGSLAAGAAHELSTPLSTLNLLSESLLEKDTQSEFNSELYRLRDQLQICKKTVDSLRISAADPSNFLLPKQALQRSLEEIFDTWLLLWPNIDDQIDYLGDFDNFELAFDKRLQQTLLSILNNASEASLENGSTRVYVEISCQKQLLNINIYDEGTGSAEQLNSRPLEVKASSKRKGIGLGLMLSQSNMQQLGGSFVLLNKQHPASQVSTGICASVTLQF